MSKAMRFIADQLIPWQKTSGRHDLPWQQKYDPYAVWLSEVMLQQTQVGTVIPYFQRFISKFPDIGSLAQASIDDVLASWSGLGYYSRARNLHRTARMIVHEFHGIFPQSREALQQLPGIGRSTAAAIAVFAFGQRDAILDGNVKRIFARFFGIDRYSGQSETLTKMWRLAEESLPQHGNPDELKVYTQALMDLGATVCIRNRPLCGQCPLRTRCVAYIQDRVAQLPVSKPRNKLPEKETVFMIYRHENKLLLEKRPDEGIWGGLWCFPEVELNQSTLKLKKKSRSFALPQLRHTFTHFRLLIRPCLQDVVANNEASAAFVWKSPEDALMLGIPVPVKKIIQQYFVS